MPNSPRRRIVRSMLAHGMLAPCWIDSRLRCELAGRTDVHADARGACPGGRYPGRRFSYCQSEPCHVRRPTDYELGGPKRAGLHRRRGLDRALQGRGPGQHGSGERAFRPLVRAPVRRHLRHVDAQRAASAGSVRIPIHGRRHRGRTKQPGDGQCLRSVSVSASSNIERRWGTASSRQIGQTFWVTGSGYTAGGMVRRYINPAVNGSTVLTPLTADGSGNLSWTFTPMCDNSKNTVAIYAVDDATGRTSNTITERVTGLTSCP